MYTVYILQNSMGHFYIGQTSNLEERLKRHSGGRSEYTRHRGPWILMHHEEYETREMACSREKELKGWKSAEKMRRLIAAGQHTP